MRRVLATLALAAVLAGGVVAQEMTHELKVGDMAPDFSLPGTDGKVHTLADYRGKQAVVLAWFPKAFTSGCTIECKSLAEHSADIRKFDVAYFMASVDPIEGEQGNKAFAAAHDADFPLLSDTDKSVATSYGVLSPRGVANRWTFYIGKDGRIAAIDKAVKPASSAADMIAKLDELHVSKR